MEQANTSNVISNRAQLEWQQGLDLEKKLRQLIRKKGFWDQEVRALRTQLRTSYESVLFLDAAFASVNEVEQVLWKSCCYQPIEEFRARLRRAEKSEDPAGREQLPKVAGALLRFLDDCATFYRRLVAKLQGAYGDVGVQLGEAGAQAAEAAEAAAAVARVRGAAGAASSIGSAMGSAPRDVRVSIHRCLIYLGDLSRYMSQAAPKGGAPGGAERAHFERAVGYYREAARVYPRSGNPHNQLAVMAYMRGDELRSVYYYIRALSCAVPFTSARENLLTLFEQNRTRHALLQQQLAAKRRGDVVNGGDAAAATRPVGTATICLVRLAGLLYDRINTDDFDVAYASAFSALKEALEDPAIWQLLSRSAHVDALPMHATVVAAVALEAAVAPAGRRPGGGGAKHAAGGSDAAARALHQARAASVFFRLGAQLLRSSADCLHYERPGASALVGAANVALQFLVAQPQHAVSTTSTSVAAAAGAGPAQLAPAVADEAAQRTAFWTSAAALVAQLAPLAPPRPASPAHDAAAGGGGGGSVGGSGGGLGGDCQGGPRGALPEEWELLGFEPLRSGQHWQALDVGHPADDEAAARACRALAAARALARRLAASRRGAPAAAVGSAAAALLEAEDAFVAAALAAGARPAAGADEVGGVPSEGGAPGATGVPSPNGHPGVPMDLDPTDEVAPGAAPPSLPAAGGAGGAQAGGAGADDDDDDDIEGEVIVLQPQVRPPAPKAAPPRSPARPPLPAWAGALLKATPSPPPMPAQLLANGASRHAGGGQGGTPAPPPVVGAAPPSAGAALQPAAQAATAPDARQLPAAASEQALAGEPPRSPSGAPAATAAAAAPGAPAAAAALVQPPGAQQLMQSAAASLQRSQELASALLARLAAKQPPSVAAALGAAHALPSAEPAHAALAPPGAYPSATLAAPAQQQQQAAPPPLPPGAPLSSGALGDAHTGPGAIGAPFAAVGMGAIAAAPAPTGGGYGQGGPHQLLPYAPAAFDPVGMFAGSGTFPAAAMCLAAPHLPPPQLLPTPQLPPRQLFPPQLPFTATHGVPSASAAIPISPAMGPFVAAGGMASDLFGTLDAIAPLDPGTTLDPSCSSFELQRVAWQAADSVLSDSDRQLGSMTPGGSGSGSGSGQRPAAPSAALMRPTGALGSGAAPAPPPPARPGSHSAQPGAVGADGAAAGGGAYSMFYGFEIFGGLMQPQPQASHRRVSSSDASLKSQGGAGAVPWDSSPPSPGQPLSMLDFLAEQQQQSKQQQQLPQTYQQQQQLPLGYQPQQPLAYQQPQQQQQQLQFPFALPGTLLQPRDVPQAGAGNPFWP